ncbi:MAG: AI-2E family transporter [bacterium]|nr:AI-2E family transporter [bacterium]
MSQTVPNFSNSRWFLIALGLLIVCVALWSVRNILMLGLAAVILVTAITIPVGLLARVGIKRNLAIALTFIGSCGLLYLLAMVVLPTIIDQFVTLATEVIPRGVDRAIEFWNSGQLQQELPFLQDLNADEIRIDANLLQDVASQVLNTLRSVGGTVLPFVGGIANTFLSTLIVFFLSMFFLSSPEKYKRGLVALAPLWYRHRVRFILERIGLILRRWLYAQMIGMTLTGTGTFIGLSLIGIEQAAALAVLTALFSFVPNFGELLAASVALAVGLVQAPDRLILILMVIYGVSFVQNQILGPLITAETVDVPPVLVLLGQIVVAGFFGVLGIVMAVPIIAIAMVLVQEVYIKDILGDRPPAELQGEVGQLPARPPQTLAKDEGLILPDGI